ncbi:MAG: short-chain dehydrogenase [Polyangiaceae bacterium]|nr:short-chain dehydrogenase [Polyangiaceae bacterium]
MDIRGKTVLILGGYGLVGQAVARRLLREIPRELILLSLRRKEAEEAVAALRPEAGPVSLKPAWGDIFTLTSLKDIARREVMSDPENRKTLIERLLDPLPDEAASGYYLYDLITSARPDIIVDAVNTATGLAYQDIYKTSRQVYRSLNEGEDLREGVELLLMSSYVPQLIRHVQVLYQAMVKAQTNAYIKIGTSGTGGMGLNIPYTHSEEKPSRVLLSKSAVAGAHSMLLFLLARTPGGPITKEIKPAAAIAWKRIGYGEILRGGRPVPLFDADPSKAVRLALGAELRPHDPRFGEPTGENLSSVFIDTGENGLFSLEEFSAITTGEQMEFVTPEEIADVVARELMGGNTGHDIINALDNAVMGPTYRAGLMRHWALEKLRALEETHRCHSIAFENLGPPRLSKLLHEANLLRRACGSMEAARSKSASELSSALSDLVYGDASLRRQIISIGIPILLPDGRLLRGPECKIPASASASDAFSVTPESVEAWALTGWVDLREANMERWKERFDKIRADVLSIPADDSSSRFLRGREFWGEEDRIQPGKVVGWIFATEEKGARMK